MPILLYKCLTNDVNGMIYFLKQRDMIHAVCKGELKRVLTYFDAISGVKYSRFVVSPRSKGADIFFSSLNSMESFTCRESLSEISLSI